MDFNILWTAQSPQDEEQEKDTETESWERRRQTDRERYLLSNFLLEYEALKPYISGCTIHQ